MSPPCVDLALAASFLLLTRILQVATAAAGGRGGRRRGRKAAAAAAAAAEAADAEAAGAADAAVRLLCLSVPPTDFFFPRRLRNSLPPQRLLRSLRQLQRRQRSRWVERLALRKEDEGRFEGAGSSRFCRKCSCFAFRRPRARAKELEGSDWRARSRGSDNSWQINLR